MDQAYDGDGNGGERPEPPGEGRRERVPAFNIPGVLLAVLALLGGIHLLRWLLLSDRNDLWVIYAFGFTPARYAGRALELPFPLGDVGDLIGFVSYTLLHGGVMHLVANALWLVAFGAPVARRLGASRFLLLGAVASLAGALAHLATHWGEPIPMVGASAAVSGYMAAAIRFAFTPGGPLSAAGRRDPQRAVLVPAVGILAAFRQPAVVVFTAIWVGVNVLFGTTNAIPGAGDAGIAWQAHIGGFLAGLLLFALFDPVRRPPVYPGVDDTDVDADDSDRDQRSWP